jgi:hypothetical protein
VLDRPQFVSAGKVIPDLDPSNHAPLFLATASLVSPVVNVTFTHREGDLPPPLDLITTLRVLLI